MDTSSRPQIIEHCNKSVNLTVHTTRWLAGTARFVALGQYPRQTGSLQVYELDGTDAALVHSAEHGAGFKCGSLGASSSSERHLATGSFAGLLQVWDLTNTKAPIFSVQAHQSIVNDMDGFGGRAAGFGPPELVTCGRDGAVRVWDVRQKDAPVAAFEPADSNHIRDCWCVAIGNSHNDQERCVLAGYDNGDVKMFDLRTGTVRWEDNVKNGVCGVQFDRPDIPMNKFVVTCLESQFQVYDARTQHPEKGFANTSATLDSSSTVWGVHHLPDNRDVAMITSGDGNASLWRYSYPDQRKVKDQHGVELGVAGSMQQLSSRNMSSQPINSFDWSRDKSGLFVCSAFDQCIRVGFVTKLNKL